jgi:hypothetical protein
MQAGKENEQRKKDKSESKERRAMKEAGREER